MLIMILLGPLELVSPILEFTNGSSFRRQVEHVWEHLEENTKINVNEAYPLIHSVQQWNLDLRSS
jgi:hypothetical protein